MSLNILYLAPPDDWPDYQRHLTGALAQIGLDAHLARDIDPAGVDYIIYAPQKDRETDFSRYPKCRAVLSLWAGVEHIVSNPTLTQPLARMADASLREGMVEWVMGHVLRYHLGMDAHITGQDGHWRDATVAPLARQRKVGILGLGALGTACATALAALNFQVSGWARKPRQIDAIDCLSGADGLLKLLQHAEILVALLPETAQTQNILNADRLALLPKGARILNPGRGALIDDAALLAALDAGHIAHATLDVFRTEPLPPDHPYWTHAQVTVTPHIASATRPDTAANFVADNIARVERGKPPIALVDRAAGY